MDKTNVHTLKASTARAKLLLDANVISYAQKAHESTGTHLLEYLESLKGTIDWFISSGVAVDLYNNKVVPGLFRNILNCDYPDMKMDQFPYDKEDGNLGFVKLNSISGDDWSQICLAYNHPELIIVTNDARMFKSAHATLKGRTMTFHEFLDQLSPYWYRDQKWLALKDWLNNNVRPLRNNSSWILPDDSKH